MDFDIGNFLYILLMLVFIILGSLGKKKKPASPSINAKEPDNAPAAGDIPADIFEENIRKFFTGESEKITFEEDSYRQPVNSSPEPVLDTPVSPYDKYSGILDVPSKEEGLNSTFKMTDKMEEVSGIAAQAHLKSLTSLKTNFVNRALKDFNPKKAILYKEVFQPKYF